MGWTHSWQRDTELNAAAFDGAISDCRAAFATSGVALAGFDGTGTPILEPDHIVFNGSTPASCEPFEMARVEFDRRGRSKVWGFCKTEHLPYDLCVQTALIIMRHHLGAAIEVGSDGSMDDWRQAVDLVQKELGYGADFQLTDFG